MESQKIYEAAELIATASAVSIVTQFSKTIALKAGEDVYHSIRNHAVRPAPIAPVQVVDPGSGTVFVFVPPLPNEAIAKLALLKPRKIASRVVTWDRFVAEWKVSRER